MAIADAEGIDAVSMRRVAADLGAGTMTLYHYVKSKSELEALMDDLILSEMLVDSSALTTGWRDALTAIAHQTRDTLIRHPWAVYGMGGGGMSPNALRHFEQSLAAVDGTGLPGTAKVELIELIDDFVCGFVAKTDIEPGAESLSDETMRAIAGYLDTQLDTGHFPQVAKLLGGADRAGALRRLFGGMSTPDERFARGLGQLLDGVAVAVDRGI